MAKGSLSARIQRRTKTFRVQRLGERLSGSAYTREVVLHGDEVPVVVARSTTAGASLRGPWRAVLGLGTRPLADILFRDPLIHRRGLEFARLDPRHGLWGLADAATAGAPTLLWARRSLFMRQGRALEVVEIFLPAILELPSPQGPKTTDSASVKDGPSIGR